MPRCSEAGLTTCPDAHAIRGPYRGYPRPGVRPARKRLLRALRNSGAAVARRAYQPRCSRRVPCLLVERAERRVVERACASKGKSGRHWHRGEGSTICCTCGVWGLSGCLDPSPSQAAVPSGGTVTKAFDMLAYAQSSAVCGRASTRRSRRRGGGRGRRSSARWNGDTRSRCTAALRSAW